MKYIAMSENEFWAIRSLFVDKVNNDQRLLWRPELEWTLRLEYAKQFDAVVRPTRITF